MPDRTYVTVEEFERMKAERDAAIGEREAAFTRAQRAEAQRDDAIAHAKKAREAGVEATFLRVRNSLGLAYEKMVRAVVDPVLFGEEWSNPEIEEENDGHSCFSKTTLLRDCDGDGWHGCRECLRLNEEKLEE